MRKTTRDCHFKELNEILSKVATLDEKTILRANSLLKSIYKEINGIMINETFYKKLLFFYLLGEAPMNYDRYDVEFLELCTQIEKKPKVNLRYMNDLFLEFKETYKTIPTVEEFRKYVQRDIKTLN